MALPDTASNVVNNVTTRSIGFAPILKYYFEKCAIAKIIDNNIPIDPRRKVLTHGQAAVAMITGLLFQVMQLYRICQFADKTTMLNVILPAIQPEEYFDDRLADTPDAIYDYGIGDLELELPEHMIETFRIRTDICHNDTSSASYYGKAGHNRYPKSIEITFGHSKKHRDDLKQPVWSMTASGDAAFPLFQHAYSGNKADVNTYVEQWINPIDLLSRKDFLYVADCKLISKENVAAICDNDGFFPAQAPMYECSAKVFESAMADHDHELLIGCNKGRFNRGFEAPTSVAYEGKNYPLRMIILFDHEAGRSKRMAIDTRIEKTHAAFKELKSRLNRRKLKSCEAVQKACADILKKHHTRRFFTFRITNTPVVTFKNNRRGRHAGAQWAVQKRTYLPSRKGRLRAGIDLFALPRAHRSLSVFFKIAVLIERTARRNIEKCDRGLDDFMPDRDDVGNPESEYLLSAFEYVVAGLIPMADGNKYGFISELDEIQLDILSVLETPKECFSFPYIFNSG